MLRRVINVVLLGGGKIVQNKKVRKAASVIASEGLKKGTKAINQIKAKNKKTQNILEEIIVQLENKIEEQQREIDKKDEQIIKLKEDLLSEQVTNRPLTFKKRLFGRNK